MYEHLGTSRRKIGERGEDIAVWYLESKGYRIISRNYQIKGGEIDIIAKYEGIIAFVEVRYRKNEFYGHPLDTFSRIKRQTIVRTVFFYLQKHGIHPEDIRIDFIGIMPKKDGTRGYFLWHKKGIDIGE